MASKVRKIALPQNSALHAFIKEGDFIDCFATKSDAPLRKAAETVAAFPVWVQFMLKIRKLVTAPFGLMQEGPEDVEKLGPFPIVSETENEIIAGFDDKHLNFRVSVMSENGQLSLATWVHTHNLGGRVYLSAILPFHILVARDAVTRAAAQANPPLARVS